jgi:hypothetical protein
MEAFMNRSNEGLEDAGAYGDLLGQQYYDLVATRRPPNGPRTLMFAVLEDGIRCYLVNMHATRPARRRQFEEARAWMENRRDIGPFGFETLCGTFDIDPDKLRNQLRTMSGRKLPRRLTGIVGRPRRLRAAQARGRKRPR